ncbi:WGxxGxxG family protein [Paenibacillus yonginensis]|uniref:WGxxGxxG family protein n=1 Tax=Paenibacillus yonginensis TaxID=1462996 RepID=UPI0008398517|nr:WGxxGxxG family protein [Paenibacillus yonginensis]
MKKKLTALLLAAVVSALMAIPAAAYGTNDTVNANNTNGHMQANNVRTYATDGNNHTDWGWLGLLGLLGLAGLRRRSSERS